MDSLKPIEIPMGNTWISMVIACKLHRTKSSWIEFHLFFRLNCAGVVTQSTMVLIVGILIFLLSFLGCCGAIKENKCMILTVSEHERPKMIEIDNISNDSSSI